MGQHQLQEAQVPGPVLGSQEPHAKIQAWRRVVGKLPVGKGLAGVG